MTKFELVSGYEDTSLLPKRATSGSAGYDFVVAEDIVIPSYESLMHKAYKFFPTVELGTQSFSLDRISQFNKKYGIKPTLVPTGVKACMNSSQYLQLSVRSSCPLKNWLILANGVGIIDADYYNNPDNEGHIYFQIINLFPYDIQLKKGDKIGQGIFLNYNITDDNIVIAEQRIGGFGSTDA